MSKRTAIYRFFNKDDALLYVGITDHLGTRWDHHARKKPWWPQVCRQTAEWHDTRAAAEQAERDAIRTEAPLWNINLSPWLAVPGEDGQHVAVLKPPPVRRKPVDATPVHNIRIPTPMWEAFDAVAKRLGTTRSASLLERMRTVIREHGTEEQLDKLAEAEQELAERRARMHPGRPPKKIA